MAAPTTTKPSKQPPVCFSFAAYAKSLINHLSTSAHNIPIELGLTDRELTSIEATFNFTFPPDLRAILREGLPVASTFPNWRSSSPQQLRILLNLPSLSLLRQISAGTIWCQSWGPKNGGVPPNQLLKKASVLVPIYRNCYVPSQPSVAGNPVFYIDAETVRILSCDVTRFFGQEFGFMHFPVWAPKAPRRIDFWSEVAARGEMIGWWSKEGLGGYFEEVFWRLREGGWKEEEVREMMMMGGSDGKRLEESGPCGMGDREDEANVGWRVRRLSMILLRGGWTREDVVDSLGLESLYDVGEGLLNEND